MQSVSRARWQLLLLGFGVLLIAYALWGLTQTYPDFNQQRVAPAQIRLSPPTATPTP